VLSSRRAPSTGGDFITEQATSDPLTMLHRRVQHLQRTIVMQG